MIKPIITAFLLLQSFSWISCETVAEEAQVVACDQGPTSNILWYCSLTKVQLKKNQKIKPTAKNSTLVRSVYITDSTIPTFGEELCNEFSSVEDLWLLNIGTEEIISTALKKCTKLKRLYVWGNPLRQLNKDTFKFNTNLEVIDFSGNQIRDIPNDLFYYTTKLEYLSLYNNILRDFTFEKVKRTSILSSLNIASNDISDLNEISLLQTLPQLRDISYNDNELSCARVVEINRVFNDAKVIVRTIGVNRERFYPTREVQGILCLDDQTWNAATQRKSLTRKNLF